MDEDQKPNAEANPPEPEEEAPRKRSLLRGLKLGKFGKPAGIVVAVLAFEVFSSQMLVKRMLFAPPPPPVKEQGHAAVGEFYMIPDLIINPAASGGRRHLLISIGLEYHDPEMEDELAKRDPQIRDNLITLLASQDVNVLTDIRYRENIRRSLLKAVNYYIDEGEVNRLYFVKYVFQ
jgi:flagellar basal body-associated protein FliL